MKKGISLIVLIITILVIIVLSTGVILISVENNPINRANEGTFKGDMKTLKDELALNIRSFESNGKNMVDINANKDTNPSISEYIPKIKSKYLDILEIKEGELIYIGTDETEIKWCQDINMQTSSSQNINEFNNNGSTISNAASVNKPRLQAGMSPIKFNETTGEPIKTNTTDPSWYSYINTKAQDAGLSKWANVQTIDGSQFVWIPRFAYKIKYVNDADKSKGATIDVVFLKGTTDIYIEGNTEKTAKRAGDSGAGTEEYMVHPAFTSDISSGGYEKELTGFFVSKYEAGFAGENGISAHASSKEEPGITYSLGSASRNIYGSITSGVTKIKYPVFKSNAYAYNNINISDAYELSKALNSSNNPYGFNLGVNVGLIKDSQIGAVIYLAHSKYGRSTAEITMNNCNVNNSAKDVYAVTGIGADSATATNKDNSNNENNKFNGIYGKLASTTRNVYGVYDLSGGVNEYTASYILNPLGSSNRSNFGAKLVLAEEKNKNVYLYNTSSDTANQNYNANSGRFGNAVFETSTIGSSNNSFFNDYSNFLSGQNSFMLRGGSYFDAEKAGLFSYTSSTGKADSSYGFRVVII